MILDHYFMQSVLDYQKRQQSISTDSDDEKQLVIVSKGKLSALADSVSKTAKLVSADVKKA